MSLLYVYNLNCKGVSQLKDFICTGCAQVRLAFLFYIELTHKKQVIKLCAEFQ